MNELSPKAASRWTAVGGVVLFLLSLLFAYEGGFGLPSRESLGGMAGAVLLVLTNIPLLAALWLAALGWGVPLRRSLVPRAQPGLVIQAAVGVGCLLMLAWLMAVVGLLNAASAWGLCAAGWLLLVWQMSLPENRHHWRAIQIPAPPWPLLLAAPIVAIFIVACTIPPSLLWSVEAWGYDALSYHLELPREWLALGQMQGLEHNVYSYLPSLGEAGYMLIGAMRGSMYDAISTAQFFHASLAVLAAMTVGGLVHRFAGKLPGAGVAAGVIVLAVPWMLVTGSLPYNEMFMLSLGGAAMLVALSPEANNWRGGALAGFLAGLSTLAKLPAGPMIAVPVGLILVLGLNEVGVGSDMVTEVTTPRPRTLRGRWRVFGAFAIAGLLTLAPYFIRNAVWTGNPVFPFAAKTLGKAHWTDVEVKRWTEAHAAVGGASERLTELGRQWLFNSGYGAVGATPRQRTHAGPDWRNVASFGFEWGFPVFWTAAALGTIAGLTWPGRRRLTLAMLLTLACQIAFWILVTHLQSRFLIESLLPGGVLIGLGIARIEQSTRRDIRLIGTAATVAIITSLTFSSFTLFIQQTQVDENGEHFDPWMLADSLPPNKADLDAPHKIESIAGDHPINQFVPQGGKVLLIADVSRLLYIRRPVIYNSAFDPDPLGRIIRETHGDDAAITAALKKLGVTHVWVHWAEFVRLWDTYGYDTSVTPEKLRELTAGWNVVYAQPTDRPVAELFALP